MMAALGVSSAVIAEEAKDGIKDFFHQEDHTPNVLLDVRARYEYGDQDGETDTHVGSIRARVGLESQDYNGFSGLVEFEATRREDNGGTTAIADFDNTELNRISLQYKKAGNQAIVGRQRIIINNARFVGNVGWRQNEQTYDAAYYKNTMVDGLSAEYAYLDGVKRIFGSEAAYDDRTWESDSHILNVKYSGLEGHTFAAYAYLLEFENGTPATLANSSDTFGANYDFKGTIADHYKINAYAELAYQQDGGDNPVDYDAMYLHLKGSVAREGWSGFAGYELLGSDDGTIAFRTPLATGHAFNGWNDQFLTTPADGLNDFYAGVGFPVPKVPMKLIYHHFWADDGNVTYGDEIDYVATHKLNPKTTAIAKASYFIADDAGYDDRFRLSVEVNYKF
jgi:hypothetical protein